MRIEMMHPADQLVYIMNRIYSHGLTTMTGGNLSVRESNGDLWVTPGGIDKGNLLRSDMVCLHPDGRQEGFRKPTSELLFHQAVYAACNETRAILHAHSPALSTFCLMHQIPTINLNPNTRLICGKIGSTPYARTGSAELAALLADEFKQGCSLVLIENHGVCVVAESLGQAYMIFETLEYTARSELLARRLGPLHELSEAQIDIARTKNHTRLTDFRPRSHSSEELAMRRDMVRINHRAVEQRLFTSTQGTMSACLSDGSFLITPYGADRHSIQEEDLVLVSRSMKEAGKTPSRAVFLHELVYHHCPDIRVIVCAQPTFLMAYTLTGSRLDTCLMGESYHLLKQLPVAPYGFNYSDPKKIVSMLSLESPAILLENDGIITTGQNLIQTFDRLETAEFAARTQLDVTDSGELHPLTADQIAEIEAYYRNA